MNMRQCPECGKNQHSLYVNRALLRHVTMSKVVATRCFNGRVAHFPSIVLKPCVKTKIRI